MAKLFHWIVMFILNHLLFSFFACRKPCDVESLQASQNADQILLACDLTSESKSQKFTIQEICLQNLGLNTLEIIQPSPSQQFSPSENHALRIQVYETCQLHDLASKEEFVFSNGDPIQAAQLYFWLQEHSVENAAQHAQKVFSPSPFVDQVDFSTIATAHFPKIQPEKLLRLSENIDTSGAYGRYPGWHIPMTVDAPLVLSNNITIKTLRYLIASTAHNSSPLQLAFWSNSVVGIPIYAPSQSSLPVFDGTGTPPEELRIRLNISDDKTIADLIPILESLDGKEIELAIDHRPCDKAPEGMQCHYVNQSPIYMDTQPYSETMVKDCGSAQGCKAAAFTWTWAAQFCQFQGKRLPTIEEFQQADISGRYWTLNWDTAQSTKSTCADGVPNCQYGTHFLTSDGKSFDKNTKVSTMPYCASDNHILSDKEPYFISDPFPEPPAIKPNPELAKIANSIEHDILEDKGICGEDVRKFWKESLQRGGRSSINCRDPLSYVTSNEPWRYVWGHHLKNLGGGYVGVGSDQGYDFISSARSEWAWIYDYDPNIYRLHKLLRAVILQAQTPEEFVSYFTDGKSSNVEALLLKEYPAEEVQEYMAFYYAYVSRMARTYQSELKPYALKDFGWLAVVENYTYIRQMYQQDRIVIVKGDLMGDKAFPSISAAAQKMEIPIRIFYVSNAPLAWGGAVTPGFRKNIEAMMPAYDENSVYLITHGGSAPKINDRGRWVYITSNAQLASQRLLQHYISDHIMWDSEKSVEMDLRTVGIPNKRHDIITLEFETIMAQ